MSQNELTKNKTVDKRVEDSQKERNTKPYSEDTHLKNAASIRLLSKFHLNPLIVNSITQTACMRAHMYLSVSLRVGVHM